MAAHPPGCLSVGSRLRGPNPGACASPPPPRPPSHALPSRCQEYVNGQRKNKYGDTFIRGNNGAWQKWRRLAASFTHRATPLRSRLPLLGLTSAFICSQSCTSAAPRTPERDKQQGRERTCDSRLAVPPNAWRSCGLHGRQQQQHGASSWPRPLCGQRRCLIASTCAQQPEHPWGRSAALCTRLSASAAAILMLVRTGVARRCANGPLGAAESTFTPVQCHWHIRQHRTLAMSHSLFLACQLQRVPSSDGPPRHRK